MTERREYTLSDEDLAELREVSEPLLVIGGSFPISSQERANQVWSRIADKMGFKTFTARPVAGKTDQVFSAEPRDD